MKSYLGTDFGSEHSTRDLRNKVAPVEGREDPPFGLRIP